jgi:hypothetical protein
MMKLPIPMQRFLNQHATRLGSSSNHERDDVFRDICDAARGIGNDPLYRGALAEQLLLMGKRFTYNRSDDSIRATVISEFNKVAPIRAIQDKASVLRGAVLDERIEARETVAAADRINAPLAVTAASARQPPSGHGQGTVDPIIKTAADLRTMAFAPLKYIIPELIVEGCVLLAGRPKAGKSWLALDVGVAVAVGRYCLGERKPEQGRVLYLALEDGDRRMQRRITKLLPTFGCEWPETFQYAIDWPRADQGGVEAIDNWCEKHPNARLVVIDVLAKFRAPSRGKNNVYEQDYAALSKLQELATRRSITILVVHHTRKGDADDPVEEISGTLGLSGAADAFLVLKKARAGATLVGRCRDTEDVDLAVRFSRETCRWTILGEAAEVQTSDQRARVLAVLENAPEGLSIPEIRAGAQLCNRNAVDLLLSKMAGAGAIVRIKRGTYCLPQYAGRIRQKGQKDTQLSEIKDKSGNLSDLSHLSGSTGSPVSNFRADDDPSARGTSSGTRQEGA